MEGETLRSRLEREGRLGAEGVVSILQDVVDPLAYAHANGLVHRDIKPENILLQRHHALVTDFGVAKAIIEALPGIGAATAGIAVGTPAYMAPEQLAADPAADHRVDLYAIGLLAYELLSGSSPFTGSSPQQTWPDSSPSGRLHRISSAPTCPRRFRRSSCAAWRRIVRAVGLGR